MKQCPLCNRTYTDETLTYCLDDGTVLSIPYDPQATQRMPLPRVTNPTPTEVLPATEILPTDQSRTQPPQQRRTPWFIYALIVLVSVVIGGGIVTLLKSEDKNNRQPDSSISTARQTSTNVNQGNVPSSNENKQSYAAKSNTTSNSSSDGKDSSSSSGNTSPSQQLVGVWQTNVSEFGRKFDITLTLRADGNSKYLFIEKGQKGTSNGTWQYSDGVLYETFSNGSSGKGSIQWIDKDTFELTIIDNGVPAYTGLKRRYRRAG